MNRRDRRAQPKGSPAPGGAQPDIQRIFDAALAHHRAGQLPEADQLYRQVLAAAPRHADSLHLLGVVARQAGRSDTAVELIGKAIRINGEVAFYHSNLGNALKDLGRPREAVAAYRTAIRLAPDAADTHNSLGNALKDLGRFDDALAAYGTAIRLKPDFALAHCNLGNALKDAGRPAEAVAAYETAVQFGPDIAEIRYNLGVALREMGRLGEALAAYNAAIRIRPDHAETHNNLGNALRDLGRLEDAVAAFKTAIRFGPDLAEPHNNLGGTLKDLGRFDEAVAAYEAAIRIRPDYAEAHSNLGAALCELGRPDDGLACCVRSLKLKETAQGRSSFVECLIHAHAPDAAEPHAALVMRALDETWSKPGKLAPVVVSGVSRRLAAAGIDDATDFAESDAAMRAIDCLAGESLLLRLLRLVPIHDEPLERVLTACRAALLRKVAANAEILPDPILDFLCALADQCFVNEYVFDCAPDESALAERLREAMVKGRTPGAADLVALGCYVPLHSIEGASALPGSQWPGPVARMLSLQIADPLRELAIRAEIPQLTPIGDGVSADVRLQYEENPYPRWVKTERPAPCASVESHIRNQIPRAPLVAPSGPTAEILIAGCGTGLHPVETAQIFPNAQVLAVDLSLASLGYAARKADELALGNLKFAQADILRLGGIGRQFDAIESVGVLHHLENPEAGLEVLVSLLKPGGFLRLGLYSAHARRNVVAVRGFIAEHGFLPTADGIRRCRREIRALDGSDIRRTVAMWDDFASASGCRDLIFHVQEHRCTLPEIERWLGRFGLAFLGFDIAAETVRAFRSAHPDPGAETDLALWDAFENRHPEIFAGMYQFWARRAA